VSTNDRRVIAQNFSAVSKNDVFTVISDKQISDRMCIRTAGSSHVGTSVGTRSRITGVRCSSLFVPLRS